MTAERISVYLAVIAAGILDYITGLHKAYIILLLAMAVDVALGTMLALYTGRASSEVSFRGLTRKLMVLVFVFYVGVLARSLGGDLGVNIPAGEVVAVGYTVRESISIIEKLAGAGIWVPDFVRRALAEAERRFDGADGKGPQEPAS